jgi:arrestin-related trafficking adapter 1
MPHRVATFFRKPSTSLESQVSSLKRATAAVRRASSPNSSPRSSERTFSYASSIEDDASEANHRHSGMNTAGTAARQSAAVDNHDGRVDHHRLSFPGLHFGRSSKESHANSHASLDWKLESPPIVFYGDADSSSGALVSGQLFLNVKEEDFHLESFRATLKVHVVQKRPFAAHCTECTNQYTEIEKWTFLDSPPPLSKGTFLGNNPNEEIYSLTRLIGVHTFPFSVLLGGHLPTTIDGPLMSISYEFKAEVIPIAGFGSPVKFDRILNVKRSLPSAEIPHHSVRVFPPTNIKASAHFPQVIHPTGVNNLSLRLDGIAKYNAKGSSIEYWRLKKLTWKLEEVAKTVAPACAKHTPKDAKDEQSGTAKKGMQRTDTRVIGEKTMFSGWKSSYGGVDNSSVEMELDYQLFKNPKFTCNTKSRDGSEVTHQLTLEMVVSQEWAPLNKPSLITQTGVGRILRMHFATVLTERGGIGISWDNEAPPIYQDVPPSPPAYSHEIGEGAILEHLESLDGARSSSDEGSY